MKTFKGRISLIRNARGCYILDTVKGCSVCSSEKPLGCYDNCYAKAIADRYRIDFGNPVKRDFYRDTEQLSLFGFEDSKHESELIREIRSIKMPFVRIGEMGDPSEDWKHTLKVCSIIKQAGKPIVIITKHWNVIPKELLPLVYGVCINTSISAMDTLEERVHRLNQYNRLKPYCDSVLRIVSCSFNDAETVAIQDELFRNERTIDTVFRPNAKNRLVTDSVINVKKIKFLKANMLASIRDDSQYLGPCSTCPDMCGLNV